MQVGIEGILTLVLKSFEINKEEDIKVFPSKDVISNGSYLSASKFFKLKTNYVSNN